MPRAPLWDAPVALQDPEDPEIADPSIEFLESWGLAALLLLMILESSLLLYILPTEIIMAVAGAKLATTPLGLAVVVAVGTIGATFGAYGPFLLSRHLGRPFWLRHGRWIGLSAKRLDWLDVLFHRRGGSTIVFVVRLVPFIRSAISIPAGLGAMNPLRFGLLTAAGCALFNLVFAAIGYHARETGTAAQVEESLGAMWAEAVVFLEENWPIVLAVMLVAASLLVFYVRRGRQAPPKPGP